MPSRVSHRSVPSPPRRCACGRGYHVRRRSDKPARAAANPHLGAFIAVLDLPDNGQFGIARTGQRAGHITVWGDADALRGAVVAVLPVASEEERHE